MFGLIRSCGGEERKGVGMASKGCRKGAGSVSLLERGAAGRVRLYQPLEGGLRWRRGGPEGWASKSGLGEETRASTRVACETRIGDAAAAVGAAAADESEVLHHPGSSAPELLGGVWRCVAAAAEAQRRRGGGDGGGGMGGGGTGDGRVGGGCGWTCRKRNSYPTPKLQNWLW